MKKSKKPKNKDTYFLYTDESGVVDWASASVFLVGPNGHKWSIRVDEKGRLRFEGPGSWVMFEVDKDEQVPGQKD